MISRLYAKARILGHKRAKRNSSEHTSLLQVEGVNTSADANFYLGKRVAYVYRAKRVIDGSKIRCIWGTVMRSHGNSGVVKAKFKSNLPPKAFGASARVVRVLLRYGRGRLVNGKGMGCRGVGTMQHISVNTLGLSMSVTLYALNPL